MIIKARIDQLENTEYNWLHYQLLSYLLNNGRANEYLQSRLELNCSKKIPLDLIDQLDNTEKIDQRFNNETLAIRSTATYSDIEYFLFELNANKTSSIYESK